MRPILLGGLRASGLVLLSLILASMTPLPACAAQGVWEPIGPADGGFVEALAFDPSHPAIAYAGLAGGGVAKSTDGGRTWFPSGSGLDGSSTVTALAVHPLAPAHVYAVTATGVFRSMNAGRTWVRSLAGTARSVAVDPDHALVVYAGMDHGMFRSFDGGVRWQAMGAAPRGETRFSIRALAVAPSRPRTLYATYFGASSRIYRSVDGGTAWTGVRLGFFRRLAVDPQDADTLYAAGLGLSKSTDGGRTWTAVLSRTVEAMAFDASDPAVLYVLAAGVLRTSDGGATWQDVSAGLPTNILFALATDPQQAGTLLAGGQGLFRSDDAAAAWTASGQGLVNSPVNAVAVAPGGGTLYAAGPAGVYRSRDAGAAWSNVLPGVAVRALAIHPANPAIVFAAGDRVYRSRNGGDTWRALDADSGGDPFVALAIDPRDPGTVLTGAWDFWNQDRRSLRLSHDGGQTWETSGPPGGVSGISFDLQQPDTIYLSVGRDVYRSRDDGRRWSRVMNGAARSLRAGRLLGLAAAPSDGQSVAAFDNGHIYRSGDGGQTWAGLPFRWPYLGAVAFDPRDAGILYQGGEAGLLRSLDGGLSWSRFDRGLVGVVASFAFDPADPSKLYAGTWSAGVFRIDLAP